jgi:hypothetical protein
LCAASGAAAEAPELPWSLDDLTSIARELEAEEEGRGWQRLCWLVGSTRLPASQAVEPLGRSNMAILEWHIENKASEHAAIQHFVQQAGHS